MDNSQSHNTLREAPGPRTLYGSSLSSAVSTSASGFFKHGDDFQFMAGIDFQAKGEPAAPVTTELSYMEKYIEKYMKSRTGGEPNYVEKHIEKYMEN